MLKHIPSRISKPIARRLFAAVVAITLVLSLLATRAKKTEVATSSSSRGRSPEGSRKKTIPVGTTTATTRPAFTIPLYEAGADEEDPSWLLPADLRSDDTSLLIQKVEKLSASTVRWNQRRSVYRAEIQRLTDDGLIDLFWQALLNRRFKDQGLPAAWYEIVKNDVAVMRKVAHAAEEATERVFYLGITARLQSAKARLLGGSAITGDLLFVEALQLWMNEKHAFFDRADAMMRNVEVRMEAEFGRMP